MSPKGEYRYSIFRESGSQSLDNLIIDDGDVMAGKDRNLYAQFWALRCPKHTKLMLANGALFLLSAGLLVASLVLHLKGRPNLLQQTSYSTIVSKSLDPNWFNEQFITHPLQSEKSVFRQSPSDEVDKAWKRVTDVGVFTLSADEIKALGKDPSTVVKAPMEWGLGSDQHLAHLDGIHLIHCLDSMRKSLVFNFDRYHPEGISKTYFTHLSHCQEALAKHLMCQPSVELVTYNWADRQEHPFPDFDISHKCWSFDALLEWQEKNRVVNMKTEMWNALRMPKDVSPMPVPLLMLEAYNLTRGEEQNLP